MSSSSTNPLRPTFQGFINTTSDALVLFEACLVGDLNHVPRRPHDRERPDIIKSGNVFIYEEHASGIKRWTDGISWSPSRILGNFLIYRELEQPFPPGEKKRALKKSKQGSSNVAKPDPMTRTIVGLSTNSSHPDDEATLRRILVGSLVDSYDFKAGGLIKKTMSITHKGVPHHLVSYYSVDDIVSQISNMTIVTPTLHKELHHLWPPRLELFDQPFRAALEEFEGMSIAPHMYQLPNQGHVPMGTPQGYAAVPHFPSNLGPNPASLQHMSIQHTPLQQSSLQHGTMQQSAMQHGAMPQSFPRTPSYHHHSGIQYASNGISRGSYGAMGQQIGFSPPSTTQSATWYNSPGQTTPGSGGDGTSHLSMITSHDSRQYSFDAVSVRDGSMSQAPSQILNHLSQVSDQNNPLAFYGSLHGGQSAASGYQTGIPKVEHDPECAGCVQCSFTSDSFAA